MSNLEIFFLFCIIFSGALLSAILMYPVISYLLIVIRKYPIRTYTRITLSLIWPITIIPLILYATYRYFVLQYRHSGVH